MALPPYSKDINLPPTSFFRPNEVGPDGFRHSRGHMKTQIWSPGSIERVFGHDEHTYPNQDQLQHYAEIQFNPPVVPDLEAMDTSLHTHVLPHQPERQTSRPGFQNAPATLPHSDFLVVGVESSNEVGIASACAIELPIMAAIDNENADPLTTTATVRPGFQNPPHNLRDPDVAQAVSVKDSNEVGILHAIVNDIELKPGYQAL